MIPFLIKSAISLAVLLLVYKLFLEKEKMHRFNRFYLLFSLLFSFSLPFLSYSPQTTNGLIKNVSQMPQVLLQGVTLNGQSQTFGIWQWVVVAYSIITLIFIIRFATNIHRFINKIKRYKTIKYSSASLLGFRLHFLWRIMKKKCTLTLLRFL